MAPRTASEDEGVRGATVSGGVGEEGPVGEVIPLGERFVPGMVRPVLPPAPNPDNGLCSTWGEVFDHLMYLADLGEHATVRGLLKAYSTAADGVPLPDGVFAAD